MIDPATNTLTKMLLRYPKLLPWSVGALAVSHAAMWVGEWNFHEEFAKSRNEIVKEHADSRIRDGELQSKISELKADFHLSISELKLENNKEYMATKLEMTKQTSELKELILKGQDKSPRGWFF